MSILIIGEIGINHNGDIGITKDLINVAVDAGADAVKFQTFIPESVTSNNLGLAEYQKKGTNKKTHFQLLESLKLSERDFKKIILRCKKKKIKFLSSPFDIDSIILLKKLKTDIFKIPSGEINNFQFTTKETTLFFIYIVYYRI